MASARSYSFGHFRLLPDRQALLVSGKEVKVGGRAFDILVALVHNDRVLAKDELMAAAWPRVVVEENNLQVQIVALRKILGHPAIATVPGRGYRFTLPIVREGDFPSLAAENAINARASAPAVDIASIRSNLPQHLPHLFGRDDDITAVAALLETNTIVTVAGAGGIGKTRLGQAVAARIAASFPDGVAWVELAPLNTGALVASTLADVLGFDLSLGGDAAKAVVSYLEDKRALIVLDNCEHLLDAVTSLAEAVQSSAQGVRVLVTSQEVLRIAGESVYRLGTLSLPAPVLLPAAAVRASGAGALFVARAQAADSHFVLTADNAKAIAEICQRLDGIPLALELAAARVPLLGVDGVRAKLSQRFDVLTAGARAVMRRHQTLRAALDWSHDLLDLDEQKVFRRLGVFAGGFTLESAQRVASDDDVDDWDVLEHLGALIDKSLVLAEGNPIPRYRLLETTRLFALERLAAAGETEEVLHKHVLAMIALIAEIEAGSMFRYATAAEKMQLAVEGDNVRAALDWVQHAHPCVENLDDLAVELGGVAGISLQPAAGAQEAFERTLALRPHVNAQTPRALAAAFWQRLAELGAVQGHAESYDAAARGARLYADLGDDEQRFRCLSTQVAIGARRGVGREIDDAMAEARRIESPHTVVRLYFGWAEYRWLQARGRCDDALRSALDQCRIAREAGLRVRELTLMGDVVADCELSLGRGDAAEKHAREALAALECEPDTAYGVAHVTDTLAQALVLQHKHDEAIATARRAVKLTRGAGFHFRALEVLALSAAEQGRLRDAAWLTGHVDAAYAQRGEVRWPHVAARRAALDALLLDGMSNSEHAELQAQGAASSTDEAFARAFGDCK
jgi:predicted ATPase/DNA-binding winged helix-turn-helix (wHTH) protein